VRRIVNQTISGIGDVSIMEEKRIRIEEVLQVIDLAQRLQQVLSSRTQELTGLTLQQALVLSNVDMAGGKTTVSDLAQSLSRASHTVTATVNVLERRGFVSRLRDELQDRRRVWVRLTGDGRTRLATFRQASRTLLNDLTVDFGGDRAALDRFRLAISTLVELLPG
jgi:DNA-binding MarR family transcriptional regulator